MLFESLKVKGLSFKGKLVVVPWTRGQKPQRFVERSMEMTERRVQEFMIRAMMEMDS